MWNAQENPWVLRCAQVSDNDEKRADRAPTIQFGQSWKSVSCLSYVHLHDVQGVHAKCCETLAICGLAVPIAQKVVRPHQIAHPPSTQMFWPVM